MIVPTKGSYWVGRADGNAYRVDGVLNLDIDDIRYNCEDRVIFSRVTSDPRVELTYTLPVSRWEEFAREPR